MKNDRNDTQNPDKLSLFDDVPGAVLRRLPGYYRQLRGLVEQGVLRISSGELAAVMGSTAVQIRSDLRYFGGFGQQGYGYNVPYLFKNISDILGATKSFRAVMITKGQYCRGDSAFAAFAERGILFSALLLTDYESYSPEELTEMESAFSPFNHREKAALLPLSAFDTAVDGDTDLVVVHVCDDPAAISTLLATATCRGIWNLSGKDVTRRTDIPVEDLFPTDSLLRLCHSIKARKETT